MRILFNITKKISSQILRKYLRKIRDDYFPLIIKELTTQKIIY